VQGWEYGKKRLIPFSCNLRREKPELNGNRFFKVNHRAVAKFFRENPKGLMAETLGDDGGAIQKAFETLRSSVGFTHDDIEILLRDAIAKRSFETATVSSSAVGVQLDPRFGDRPVAFTFYPHVAVDKGHHLLSPWVMTPGMICAPSVTSSAFSMESECKNYVEGGFSDGVTHLSILTRLPIEHRMRSDANVLSFTFQPRPKTP
jgi:hypothetical protein